MTNNNKLDVQIVWGLRRSN